MSEALIFASTNPQYHNRLFIEFQVQYMKISSSEHVVYTNWFLFWHTEPFMYTTCSELGIFIYFWKGFTCKTFVFIWKLCRISLIEDCHCEVCGTAPMHRPFFLTNFYRGVVIISTVDRALMQLFTTLKSLINEKLK